MQSVETLFADYAAYHQTRGNKFFHWLGIPLLMLTMIAMLTWLKLFTVGTVTFDAAMVVIALSSAYYFVMEWRLAIAMIVVSIFFYFIGAALPMAVAVGLFIVGLICQYIGHKVYEHKNPAFFKNFVHVLIGPLWILNDLIPIVKQRS
jgi:uncharacterized membrane protein YGL010W